MGQLSTVWELGSLGHQSIQYTGYWIWGTFNVPVYVSRHHRIQSHTCGNPSIAGSRVEESLLRLIIYFTEMPQIKLISGCLKGFAA